KSPRAVGDKMRARSFSLEDLSSDVDTYVVSSRKESIAEGVRTAFYEAAMSSEKKGEVGVGRVDAKGNLLSIVLGGTFEARLEPEETAKKLDKGADLFVFGMAKIDKPIGEATKVKRLV